MTSVTSDLLQSCSETMISFVHNMTASYADKSNESSVVSTSVVMFILAAVFFNLNLFSGVSDVSAVLNPTVRIFLSSALNLFLPVMSYLFSEAKQAPLGVGDSTTTTRDAHSDDLSLLARVILTWMLLVELLRKKVEAILITTGMHVYSSLISHATSVAWLGNLVFFNLQAAGKKALFGVLWVLCAAKLVQRVAITEIGKRSFAHGKNARLISSYMAQLPKLLEVDEHVAADGSRMERCNFAVMGEENMVLKAGPHGYELDLGLAAAVVTVGKIWQTKQHPRLKRLCLSFALFKLLRRRFENLPPATMKETDECRDLILDGMCKDAQATGDVPAEVALFQVLNDEVNFLAEYYHSVLPVVLASPYFFVVNYLCFPVVVFGLCVMTIVLCGNGNVLYAFKSLTNDNYAVSSGILSLTKCLWKNVVRSPLVFFSIVDVSICYLLFIVVVYEEVWEFVVFLLSNWFIVSLLCTFSAKPRRRESPTFRGSVRCILWLRRNLSHYPSLITIKQFTVLSTCCLSPRLPTATLPRHAKLAILERFRGGDPLSNGGAVLTSMGGRHRRFSRLSWACQSGAVAEVILTWHIATSLLETKQQQQLPTSASRSRRTAARLSRYCAYLVAFRPELLPDDREGTERIYKDLKKGIKAALGGARGYYLSSERSRHETIRALRVDASAAADMTVLERGAVLGKQLVEDDEAGDGAVWEMLADVWVELVVYVSPSRAEEHARGHEAALAQGSELVTLLWVLATHTGIARPDHDGEIDQPAAPA
ncbi:uncharacterized protein [Oryza sativa Japonica Group]|uniref:Os06g0120200 protein n=4 Tax=Oryza TaxID=4527 RepID=Q5VQ96_ORYSJ|nr:uncharacterized protein LOC4339947 isoform X1 [Oryza sativa Japonica Group]EAY99447.1 hypothetical protein OsI_21414 [Oryza sativa Indica Group]EAZ35645.1 hypothetical protein OsJ_19931 [Oryza sativa Japonica Group]KAF2924899.1 hypothetical protein DAI22_06g012800 [Oryza sativa Japonica Group]BAD68379.1 unknown protein [Oryza sativa Japonica Group]BAF18550.1 Os06g0120200 [Oryza sativa Japonica Group]|eukprot:NP_001056636.1 Os06g0120200 [Oryza sativa Japonica Group]